MLNLFSSNNYGTKAMQAFKKLAMDSMESRTGTRRENYGEDTDSEDEDTWPGVCIAEEIAIEERESSSDGGNFFSVCNTLEAHTFVYWLFDMRVIIPSMLHGSRHSCCVTCLGHLPHVQAVIELGLTKA